ncbi:MAG: hypothetical protein MZW92_15945 [Comamonadaceae bacterium]|nr:hypothetical protein [Comamonadaceae bacterium]
MLPRVAESLARVAAGDGRRVAQPAAGGVPRQHGRARARPARLRRAGRQARRTSREKLPF